MGAAGNCLVSSREYGVSNKGDNRMKRIGYILFFMFLVYPLLSLAQERAGIDKTLENISGQYAECAAYYELVYHAMNSSNEKRQQLHIASWKNPRCFILYS